MQLRTNPETDEFGNPVAEDTTDAPMSPENSMGLRKSPKSLNPLATYEDQQAEIERTKEESPEEIAARQQAQGLQTDPEKQGLVNLGAGIMDTIATGANRYAQAMGVPGADKQPVTTAVDTVNKQAALRDQLRKNLMAQVEAKKAEREDKRKGLYEKLGWDVKMTGESRTQEDRARDDAARAAQEDPLSPQEQTMYRQLAAQRGIKLDLTTMKQKDKPEIEKAIGLGVKPESTGAGKGEAKDKKVPVAVIKQVNADRARMGLDLVPEDGTISYRDLESVGFTSGEARRGGAIQGTNVPTESFDPTKMIRNSTQEREYKTLVGEATKTKEKTAQNTSDITQLRSLLAEARSGNPVAANAAQRQIALMFNKGALSDQDVAAFSGSRNVIDRLKRAFQLNVGSGVPLTSADFDAFEALVPNLEKGVAAAQGARETDIRRRAASIHPTAGDYIFGPSTQPSTKGTESATMGDVVKVKTPNGKTWEIPRSKLEEAKKRGAVEVQ